MILHEVENDWHEEHVADRRFHSWHHNNLAHTPVPISKAVKLSVQKNSSGQRVGHITISTSVEYVKRYLGKQDVINETNVNNRKLMDLCHLKHSELAEQQPKNKGKAVLHGDNVKRRHK